MAYIRMCKQTKSAERKQQSLQSSMDPIEKAWDDQRLRHGDYIGAIPLDGPRCHPNQWTIHGVMSSGWKQVTAVRTLRVGLDGDDKELGAVASVSSGFGIAQSSWVKDKLTVIAGKRGCMSVHKSYDATPRMMGFGRLHTLLMPCALSNLCRRREQVEMHHS